MKIFKLLIAFIISITFNTIFTGCEITYEDMLLAYENANPNWKDEPGKDDPDEPGKDDPDEPNDPTTSSVSVRIESAEAINWTVIVSGTVTGKVKEVGIIWLKDPTYSGNQKTPTMSNNDGSAIGEVDGTTFYAYTPSIYEVYAHVRAYAIDKSGKVSYSETKTVRL